MLNVLIVDDDAEMRQMLCRYFMTEGWHAHAIEDGRSLVRVLTEIKTRPNLIVTDVQMPGIDGLSLLSWLNHAQPEIPVLLISAFCDQRVRERAKALGARGLVSKPFHLEPFGRLARHLALGTVQTGEFVAVG